MGSGGYKFEIWMRWGFALALVATLANSLYDSPAAKMISKLVGNEPSRPAPCEVKISRDFEHTASLNIDGMESLVRRATNLYGGINVAREACRRDPTLKTVYLRQTCDNSGGGQLSRTWFCR